MKNMLLASLVLLTACAAPPRPTGIDRAIRDVFTRSEQRQKPPAPQLEEALLPPLRMEMPQAGGQPIDQRFDLSVSNAPAAQVFNSLVSGTRYSMLVHPSVSGTITINLKDVTLREALDSIRELYGYEYKMEGSRVFIQSAGIQARVFQVNYLSAQRRGLSQLRVSSNTLVGATGAGAGAGVGGLAGAAGVAGLGGAGGGTASQVGGAISRDSTRVTTNQEAIFWSDLCEALAALIFPPGAAQAAATAAASGQAALEDRQRAICNRRQPESDRSLVVSPHSGVIVARAMPQELRAVENYLRATRLAVERQVMLEAKIIEVSLADQYQSGINWAAFGRQAIAGQVSRQTGQTNLTATGTGTTAAVRQSAAQGLLLPSPTPPPQILTGASGSVLGLAVASSNFAALLTFLETQGNVQVLSSPRVATLNNQKAVLKVGQDQLFISNVTVTPPTSTAAGTVTTSATIAPEFSPYFSGIVLDVTPQIDDRGNITLHIHPTINDVTPSSLTLDLGDARNVNVPTARNTIRETDTIVRVADGNIVAIGGLMRTEVNDVRGGLPGVGDSGLAGTLLRNTNRIVEKKELVILLKPTILDADGDWSEDLKEARERVDALGRDMARPR
jgi:MSHA biogenesis protein MshL